MTEALRVIRALDDPGVQYVAGDISAAGTWIHELDGIDVVFHTARNRPVVSRMPSCDATSEPVPPTIISPGEMLGPGDITESALGKWILEYLRTGIAGPSLGPLRIVDARDVALAMLAAAGSDSGGELSMPGHSVEFFEFIELLEAAGTDAPNRLPLRHSEEDGGLGLRPLEETLHDVVMWYRAGSRSMVA
jgi:hypothetical protein